MTFAFLERLAAERIREALRRGDFNHLPGAGKPLPADEGMDGVAPELRLASRILRNSGHVPEEVTLRQNIADLTALLELSEEGTTKFHEGQRRLRLLLERWGDLRGGNLTPHDACCRQVTDRLGESRRRPATNVAAPSPSRGSPLAGDSR